MTITAAVSESRYAGNGTTGPFAYNFRIFAATDLRVIRRSSADVETVLAYPGGYTVAGVGSASGSITTTAVVAAGETLVIRRVRPITQEKDIRNTGAYLPEMQEDALDHLTMVDLQQQYDIDRSIKLEESYDPAGYDLRLPPGSPGQAVGWNSAGTGLANLSAPSASVSAYLTGAGSPEGVVTAGIGTVYSQTDGANGKMLWAKRSGVGNTGWVKLRTNDATLSVKDFGAVGDGVADDRAAIALADAEGSGVILFPAGVVCLVSSNLAIANPVVFESGAAIRPANGVTVTFNGTAVGEGVWQDDSLGGLFVFTKSNMQLAASDTRPSRLDFRSNVAGKPTWALVVGEEAGPQTSFAIFVENPNGGWTGKDPVDGIKVVHVDRIGNLYVGSANDPPEFDDRQIIIQTNAVSGIRAKLRVANLGQSEYADFYYDRVSGEGRIGYNSTDRIRWKNNDSIVHLVSSAGGTPVSSFENTNVGTSARTVVRLLSHGGRGDLIFHPADSTNPSVAGTLTLLEEVDNGVVLMASSATGRVRFFTGTTPTEQMTFGPGNAAFLFQLPAADPGVSGQLWRDAAAGGALKVSA